MRYAVPIAEGKLAMHFGHCQQFAILETDPATKVVAKREDLTPPPHEPGVLPRWLGENGVDCIIAGGMGSRAQSLFAAQKIAVVVGAPAETPEALVEKHLAGTLAKGENICDH